MPRLNSDESSDSPFEKPALDRRFQLAAQLARSGRMANPRQADRWTRRAASVLRGVPPSTDAVARRAALRAHPDAAVSHAFLWYDDPTRHPAAVLEAFLLSGATLRHIAERLGLHWQAVEAFEAVFYDLRELHRDEGLVHQVISTESLQGPAETKPRRIAMKLTAYYAADVFESLYFEGPTRGHAATKPADELRRLVRVAKHDAMASLFDPAELLHNAAAYDQLETHINELVAQFPKFAEPVKSHSEREFAAAAKEDIEGGRLFGPSALGAAARGKRARRRASFFLTRDIQGAFEALVGWLSPVQPVHITRLLGSQRRVTDADIRIVPDQIVDFERHIMSFSDRTPYLKTGCCLLARGGGVRLIDGLRQPGSPVIVLRDYGGAVRGIAAAGRPATTRPLLEEFLLDSTTRVALRDAEHTIIVADNVAEAVAWRFLGLPAAPVDDLSDYSLERVAEVAAALSMLPVPVREGRGGAKTAGDGLFHRFTPPAESTDVVLAIPAWDPRTLSARDENTHDRILAACQPLVDHALDWQIGLGIWRPAVETLGDWQTLWTTQPVAFLDAVRQSLACDLFMSGPVAEQCVARQLPTLPEARRRLAQFAIRDPRHVEAALAREQYLAAAERERVEPLQRNAERCGDPVESALWYAASDVVRRLVELDADAAQGARGGGVEIAKLEKQLLQIVSELPRGAGGRRRRANDRAPR